MNSKQDYIRDITEIRSMMERSTRFLSLSGLSGIMAGIYALVGVWFAYPFFYGNNAIKAFTNLEAAEGVVVTGIVTIAIIILVLAIGTAAALSYRKSRKQGEQVWNAIARRMVLNMAIPLVAGGFFALLLITKGLLGFLIPVTLIFYGIAMVMAGNFSFEYVKFLGVIQVILGLLAFHFVEYALYFWAFGFGVMHIAYGIYMHLKSEG